ncbi:hypothetical protein GCM10010124_35450 [Pilimelia terevasa]|uniref:VTT domain-containing protein n=1 Tax=Pilimelia terevasa TaxID=53372 RepID=A0A8J3BT83_9ACTN|nr:DedA family protein [Pilimelia terevasa]GGK39711.1 hypothetical protein GCM10010124_35450 [Pilimelia terevasa]
MIPLDPFLASPWAYVLIAVSIAGSAVFPPLPSEAMLVTAMGLAAAGELHLAAVCATCAGGAVLGDSAAYALGRTLTGRRGGTGRAASALRWLRERQPSWGPGLIVGGRFVPGGTMAVGISAGLLRYPLRRYLPYSALGALVWAVYGVGLGFLGHAFFPGRPWAGVALALAVSASVGLTAHLVHKRRKCRESKQP